MGKEIRRGLGTRYVREARQLRDVLLGDMRRLERTAAGRRVFSSGDEFSIAHAKQLRDSIKDEEAAGTVDDFGYAPTHHYIDHIVDQARMRGVPEDEVWQFGRIASGGGLLLLDARERYVHARRPNNPHGYKPLARGTVANLDSALKALRACLKDDDETFCIEDVTPHRARKFRDEFLPAQVTHRSPDGMSATTINKTITLLSGLWVWAMESGQTGKKLKANPWVFPKGTPRARAQDAPTREAFTPDEMVKLLEGTERGTRQGDVIRLALVTGCRVNRPEFAGG